MRRIYIYIYAISQPLCARPMRQQFWWMDGPAEAPKVKVCKRNILEKDIPRIAARRANCASLPLQGVCAGICDIYICDSAASFGVCARICAGLKIMKIAVFYNEIP